MNDTKQAVPRAKYPPSLEIPSRSVVRTDVEFGRVYQQRLGEVTARLQSAMDGFLGSISIALQGKHGILEQNLRKGAKIIEFDLRVAVAEAAALHEPIRKTSLRGGLAPWLAARISSFIDANLASVIHVRDLAALADRSHSHFSRCFHKSLGEAPHAYILRKRIERAQILVLTSTLPLGQIAQECGLADQAHLNRVFRRFVGETPGEWRRTRRPSYEHRLSRPKSNGSGFSPRLSQEQRDSFGEPRNA